MSLERICSTSKLRFLKKGYSPFAYERWKKNEMKLVFETFKVIASASCSITSSLLFTYRQGNKRKSILNDEKLRFFFNTSLVKEKKTIIYTANRPLKLSSLHSRLWLLVDLIEIYGVSCSGFCREWLKLFLNERLLCTVPKQRDYLRLFRLGLFRSCPEMYLRLAELNCKLVAVTRNVILPSHVSPFGVNWLLYKVWCLWCVHLG